MTGWEIAGLVGACSIPVVVQVALWYFGIWRKL